MDNSHKQESIIKALNKLDEKGIDAVYCNGEQIIVRMK